MREARLGKPLTPECRAKLSVTHRGRKNSPEAVAKMAAFWRGRTHTEATKAKVSAARRGKPGWRPSEEQASRRGETIKVALSAEGRIDPRRGRPLSAEHRAKISDAMRGHRCTPESREQMSQAKKARNAARRCQDA